MKKLFLGLAATLMLFSCGKKEDNNNNNLVNQQYVYQNGQCLDRYSNLYVQLSYCTQNSGYVYQNGVCLSTTNGQQVPIQYCQNGGTQTYQWQGQYCISVLTNTYVDPSYCNQQGNLGQVCNGIYYNPMYGQQVQCYMISATQSSCAGQTLYNMQTSQQVICR